MGGTTRGVSQTPRRKSPLETWVRDGFTRAPAGQKGAGGRGPRCVTQGSWTGSSRHKPAEEEKNGKTLQGYGWGQDQKGPLQKRQEQNRAGLPQNNHVRRTGVSLPRDRERRGLQPTHRGPATCTRREGGRGGGGGGQPGKKIKAGARGGGEPVGGGHGVRSGGGDVGRGEMGGLKSWKKSWPGPEPFGPVGGVLQGCKGGTGGATRPRHRWRVDQARGALLMAAMVGQVLWGGGNYPRGKGKGRPQPNSQIRRDTGLGVLGPPAPPNSAQGPIGAGK